MNITNVIIIKNLQYFILTAIIVFALLSLITKNIRKKYIFLFFFILFFQAFDFTLYFGELFFLIFIPMVLFMVILFLYDFQVETYSPKNILNEDIHKEENTESGLSKKLLLKEKAKNMCMYLLIPGLFSLGFIFLFIKFSGDYTAKFDATKSITLTGFTNIANEIFFNYGILIFLMILLIFILFLWIISILLIRKKH